MMHITYPDGGYAPVPLNDLPFSGDFIMKDNATGEIVWDSRTDGYDPDGNYVIDWITLERDDSRTEGSVFVFTVHYPIDM